MRVAALLICAALSVGCGPRGTAVPFSADERRRIAQHSPLPEPRADATNAVADHDAAVRLGQFVFFAPRFSANGKVACASCHQPGHGWSDREPFSRAIGATKRHAPSLWNTAYNRWFFWDGRADSHWAQALRPLEDPDEHGGSRVLYAHLVARDAALRAAYEGVFGALPDLSDPARFPPSGRPVAGQPEHPDQRAWESMRPADQAVVNRVFANLGKAIAAFERRIVTRNAPFDRFAAGLGTGDASGLAALSPPAQRGLKLFVGRANCRQCHSGPNFTDGEFHQIGLPPRDGSAPDPGRYRGILEVLADPFNGLGELSDDRAHGRPELAFLKPPTEGAYGQFKVPTLRNIAQTPPYMHDGRFGSLDEVLEFYSTQAGALALGHHQETILRPLDLSREEKAELIAFLESLTGDPLDPALMRAPDSPSL